MFRFLDVVFTPSELERISRQKNGHFLPIPEQTKPDFRVNFMDSVYTLPDTVSGKVITNDAVADSITGMNGHGDAVPLIIRGHEGTAASHGDTLIERIGVVFAEESLVEVARCGSCRCPLPSLSDRRRPLPPGYLRKHRGARMLPG